MNIWEKNKEVESKILDIDRVSIEKKIIDLWWKKVFEWILDATWFENINWEKVRVRKEGNKVVTEYKKKIETSNNAKECIEIWYSPDNYDSQIEVFKSLWLIEISRSIKTRVSYLLENFDDNLDVRFDFDKYSDLWWIEIPELLEIEASSYDVILKITDLLWYKESDLNDWWAWDLLKYYKNK